MRDSAADHTRAAADPTDGLLVIGYGNPLREDDGVGWRFARWLQERRPDMRVIAVAQLGPELAETVSRASAVVFVDARRDGSPGAVRCDELVPAANSSGFTHSFDPATLILFAERLYARAPRAALLTVGGLRFGFGEELSAPVRRALPELLLILERRAREWGLPRSQGPGSSRLGDAAVRSRRAPTRGRGACARSSSRG